jgi:16S rRNA (guanine1207-N2)-methyltransferase
MSHYFTNDSNIKSEEHKIKFSFKNNEYTFLVDNGVFSKTKLDFGTSTLLESLDFNNIKGNVLDFGCGWGPIGIIVKKNSNANVDMVDINLRSINLSKKNSELNNVSVNVFESDVYSNVNKKYNFIITNPPIRVGKKILYDILFNAYNYLEEDGELWLVISKNQGAKSLYRDLQEKYNVNIITKNKEFYVFQCLKH